MSLFWYHMSFFLVVGCFCASRFYVYDDFSLSFKSWVSYRLSVCWLHQLHFMSFVSAYDIKSPFLSRSVPPGTVCTPRATSRLLSHCYGGVASPDRANTQHSRARSTCGCCLLRLPRGDQRDAASCQRRYWKGYSKLNLYLSNLKDFFVLTFFLLPSDFKLLFFEVLGFWRNW